jgi:O-glycosyl hydrolase
MKAFVAAVLMIACARVSASVTVAVNLGANWVGSPTIMTANYPSTNLNGKEGNWGGSPPYSLGQTFTATVSGSLTNIQMYVGGRNTTNVLYLFDMGPAIQYVVNPLSPIIPGSNGVGVNLFSSNLQTYVPNTSSDSVMELTFAGADAVQLIGGHEYYFSMVSLSSSGMYWDRDGGSTDLYPGGAAYRQNSLINGGKTTDFSLAVTLSGTNAGPTIYDCIVDWNNVHQRIDGFGACSAWRSTWTSAQATMFFSTNSGTGVTGDGKTNFSYNGVGLSLLRSRIAPGGTTVENSIMQMAQSHGARVWSTPWSPAAQFTTYTNGGNFLGDTDAGVNQAYADQLAGYVVKMKSQYGINLYAISIQNEPDVSQDYESCIWTAQQIHDFVPYLAAALAASNVASTKIIVPEDEFWETNYYATTMTDSTVATNVSIVACHDYSGSPPNDIPAALPLYDNPNAALWETETSKLSGNGAFDGSITDAMYWAGRMHLFMSGAGVNAWHYWWLISDDPDNEGLTDTNGFPAQRMYVLGQYSRFVRPNDYRIDLANYNPYAVLATAYKDPVSNNFAIVVANTNITDTNQSFYLTNFIATSVTPWITSSNLSLAAQSPVTVSNSSFSYAIPAMSVVTFAGVGWTNGPPDPTPIPTQIATAGETLLVTNGAVDANVPPLLLTFTLLTGPTNATMTPLGATNALFSWTPPLSKAGTTNLITAEVADNGTPSQSATYSFNVIVVNGVIPTIATLSSSASSVTYGTPVTLVANVSPAPTNGETVTFMNGASALGMGVLNGGTASFTTTASELVVAGSPYSVQAVYGGDGYYEPSASTNLAETVTAAAVTVASGLVVNNKTYNGSTSATISSNNVLLSGVVAGDAGSVSLSTNGYSATFATQNAGNGIAVSVSGLSFSGSAAGNYNFLQPTLSGNILPIPVTLQPASGSLKITNNFTSANNQFEVYNGNNGFSPALNGALYTNFQCDVRFAPGSATQTNGSGVLVFGLLQFGTRTSSYAQDYFGGSNYGIAVPATNTGWVHVSIPINVTNDSNLSSIDNLLIHIYGPSYATTLTGPSTLWVDNMEFVGPGNYYIVDQFNPSGSGSYSYANGQIGSVWYNWFGSAWVANSWDSTNDAIDVAANNKAYDRTTTAPINIYDTILNSALSGVLSADFASVALSTNGASASFASAGMGSNIVVTVSNLTLTGSGGGNYAVTPVTLSGSISALPVTASATANNKVYDGTTTATLNTVLSGAVSGDAVSIGYTATFATAQVGSNIAVTVSGWRLTGSAASNYALLTPTPTGLTAGITPATATPAFSGLSASQSIIYGTPVITLAGKISAAGPLYPASGETITVTINGNAQTTTISDASGDFTISYSSSALPASGAAYGITYSYGGDASFMNASDNSTALTVTPLAVILAGSRPYDGTATAASTILTVANPVNGNSVNLVSGSATLAGANVGVEAMISNGTLTLGGVNASNYTLAGASGAVTIGSVPLSITANAQRTCYGTLITLAGSAQFTSSGLQPGETIGSVTLSVNGYSSNTPVGAYTITPGTATGGTFHAADYAITYVTNTLTVTPLAVELIGTEMYNGTTNAPCSILSVSNAVGSDNVRAAAGSAGLASAEIGTNAITSFTNLILGGTTASNYTLNGAAGAVTVTPLAVVLTGTRPYDGTAAASYSILSVSNAAESDDVNVAGGSATLAGATGGLEAITGFSGLALGGTTGSNYALAGASGAVMITPVTVAVTANDQSMTFGLPIPELTATYSGFVDGEGAGVLTTPAILTTTAAIGSPAGAYPITAGGAMAANYTFDYVTGTLTVVAQPLVGLTAGTSGYRLTFPTLAGQMYQVEYAKDLSSGVWMSLGDPMPGTGGFLSISNSLNSSQTFFILQIWQP